MRINKDLKARGMYLSFDDMRGTDKVQNLFDFLAHYEDISEGDTWIHELNPEITSYLNTFSEEESELFAHEILLWGDNKTGNLADSLLDCKNPNIDGIALYGQIFLINTNLDTGEYLVQNIHLVNDYKDRPTEFYEKLISKIELLGEKLDHDYVYYLTQIREKIARQ